MTAIIVMYYLYQPLSPTTKRPDIFLIVVTLSCLFRVLTIVLHHGAKPWLGQRLEWNVNNSPDGQWFVSNPIGAVTVCLSKNSGFNVSTQTILISFHTSLFSEIIVYCSTMAYAIYFRGRRTGIGNLKRIAAFSLCFCEVHCLIRKNNYL